MMGMSTTAISSKLKFRDLKEDQYSIVKDQKAESEMASRSFDRLKQLEKAGNLCGSRLFLFGKESLKAE